MAETKRMTAEQVVAYLLEEGEADGIGQFPDVPGNRGLGEIQFLGRAGEAAVARNSLEYLQLRQRAVPEIASYPACLHGLPHVKTQR